MKVYRVSSYMNEKDITEIALNDLKDVVDVFVFLEAEKTFQLGSREDFPAFPFTGSNIVYRTFTEYPDDVASMEAMDVERLVMSKFSKILEEIGAEPDDVILYGDADEIPYKETVRELVPNVKRGEVYALSMLFCNYWVNCLSYDQPWTHFKVFTYQTLLDLGGNPHEAIRQKMVGTIVPNGGWHWSWFGGKEFVVKKLEAYGHSSLNLPQYKTDEHVERCLEYGTDLFLRGEGRVLALEDAPMPQYMIDNITNYMHLVHPKHRPK